MMAIPLRVLIVHETQADAGLLVQELRQGGFSPVWERVDTPEAMREALESQSWEIIISDCMTPRLSGLAALKLVQEMGIDLPFIIVASQMGEDLAVEAMKAGAHDYITKGDLTRLVPAVKRELREAEVRRERNRAEGALEESEELYRGLYQAVGAGVIVQDADGFIVEANERAQQLLGLSLDQMKGLTSVDPRWAAIHEDGSPFPGQDHPITVARLTGQEVHDVVAGVIHADGSRRWMLGNAAPIIASRTGKRTGAVATFVDITDRKQAEEALRKAHDELEMRVQERTEELEAANEELRAEIEERMLIEEERERLLKQVQFDEARWRALAENIPDMVTMCDAEGRVTYVNPAQSRLFGYHIEPGLIMEEHAAYYQIFHPDGTLFASEDLPLQRAALYGEEARDVEILLRASDGEERITVWDAVPLRDPGGRMIGAVAAGRDITERKRAEEERERLLASLEEAVTEAERNRAQFEAVFQAMSDGIMISDMTSNFILVNEAEARTIGFESPEDMKRNLAYFMEAYELDYPDGKPVPVEEWPISRVLRGESLCEWELRGRRRDTGREWFFSFSGEPVRDERGRQILAVVVTRDITARKRAEEERERLLEQLTSERHRLETVLETVPVGVVMVESEGRAVLANRSAEFLLGVPKEQIGATPPSWYRIQYPTGEPYPVDELPLTRALDRGDSSFGIELIVTHSDGRKLHLLTNSVPITGDEGRIIGALAAFVDVTPLRDLERQREEFISVVAHDLRGALAAIKGFAELLARPAIKDTLPLPAHRLLEGIISGSHRLERMIVDLLDVSRIEARQLALDKKPVDLAKLVDDIVQRSEELTRGHTVEVGVRGDIPQIEADPDRIEQILTNLLSNAGKYSYSGTEITVEVERCENEVMVSTTNLGPGILPEDTEKLFSRFYRTQRAKEEKVSGLGLGLYIAKGLVEAHGGRIWVESKPGEYATFRFVLPLR